MFLLKNCHFWKKICLPHQIFAFALKNWDLRNKKYKKKFCSLAPIYGSKKSKELKINFCGLKSIFLYKTWLGERACLGTKCKSISEKISLIQLFLSNLCSFSSVFVVILYCHGNITDKIQISEQDTSNLTLSGDRAYQKTPWYQISRVHLKESV